MKEELDRWDLQFTERTSHPYEEVVKKSKLAATLVKVYEDALRTGVVQVFIFIFFDRKLSSVLY